MGEKALKYGTLAKMELLSGLLNDADSLLSSLRSSLDEAQGSQAARAKRNEDLLARMKAMKESSNSQVSAVLSKMFGLTGKDPASMLTDDQVRKYLSSSFQKFDVDGSGELGVKEFISAW